MPHFYLPVTIVSIDCIDVSFDVDTIE